METVPGAGLLAAKRTIRSRSCWRPTRTHPLMALALLDDERRTEDVLPRLRRIGTWALDAFNACKAGSHQGQSDDPKELMENSRKLAAKITEAP